MSAQTAGKSVSIAPEGEARPDSRDGLGLVTEEVSQLVPLRNLTRPLIHSSCGDKDVVAIEEAKVVHLEGQNLRDCDTLADCAKLEFCFLQRNFLFKIDSLSACTNLQKLDLSSNKIQILPKAEFWRGFRQLQVLHLHDNQISSMRSLEGLLSLPAITSMTLFDNPVAEHPQYRALIVNSLSSLRAFDGYVISDAEVVQGGNFGDQYRTKSASFKLKDHTYTQGHYKHHLEQLKVEIADVMQVYMKRSPVVLLQRTLRGLMVRLKLRELRRKRKEAAIRIQRRWLKGALSRFLKKDGRDGQEFSQDFDQLKTNIGIMKLHRAAIQVQRWRREALQRRKGQRREWAARVVQKSWRRTLDTRIEFKAFHKSNGVRHLLFTLSEAPIMTEIITRARHQLAKGADGARPTSASKVHETPVLFRYTDYHIIRPASSWTMGEDGVVRAPGLLVGRSKFNRPIHRLNAIHHTRIHTGPISEEDSVAVDALPRRTNFVGKQRINAHWRNLRKYAFDLVERSMGSIDTRLHASHPRHDEANYYVQFYVKNPKLFGLVMQGVAVWNSKLRARVQDEAAIRLTPITDHEYARLSAAIAIQSAWRAYAHLKKQNPPIGRCLLIQRATLTLQCWWRRVLAKWRHRFLKRIKDLVDEVTTRDLYIDATSYHDLNDATVYRPRLLFPEHQVQFNITNSGITQLVDNDFVYAGLPLWPHCRAQTVPGDRLGETIGRMDTFALVSVNTVIDEAEDLDIPTVSGGQLLRIRFSSVFEARLRAVLIFIATYNPANSQSIRLFTTKSLYQWETDTILNASAINDKQKAQRASMARMKSTATLEDATPAQNFHEADALVQALPDDPAPEQINLVRSKINPTPDVMQEVVEEQKEELTLTGMTPFLDIQIPLDKDAEVEDRKWNVAQHRQRYDLALTEARTTQMKETLRLKEDRRKATPKLAAQMRMQAKREYTRQLALLQKEEAKYNQTKKLWAEENKRKVAAMKKANQERRETWQLKQQFAKRDLRQRTRKDRITRLYEVAAVQQKKEEEKEERRLKTREQKRNRAQKNQDNNFVGQFTRHQNLIAQQLRSGERTRSKEKMEQTNREKVGAMRDERSASRMRQQLYTMEKLHSRRVKAAEDKADIKARLISRSIHDEQEWEQRRETINVQRAATRAANYTRTGTASSSARGVLRARTASGAPRRGGGGGGGGSRGGDGGLPPLASTQPVEDLTTRWERIQASPLSSFNLIDKDFVRGDPSNPSPRGNRRPHTQASPRTGGASSYAQSMSRGFDRGTLYGTGSGSTGQSEFPISDWADDQGYGQGDDSFLRGHPDDSLNDSGFDDYRDEGSDTGTLSKTAPKGFHGSARPRMNEPKPPTHMRGSGGRSKFLIGNK